MKKSQVFLIILLFVSAGVFFAMTYTVLDNYRKEIADNIYLESQKSQNQKDKLILLQKLALISPTERHFLLAGMEAKKAGYQKISEFYFKKVNSAEGLYGLSLAYFENKNYTLAENAIKKALVKDNKESYYLTFAKVDLYQGKFEEAKKLCLEKRANNASWPEICNLVFLARDDYGQIQSPEKVLLRLVQTQDEPSRIIGFYYHLRREINPQAAYTYLLSASKKLENSRDGNLLLGNEYFNKEKYQKSAEYLEKAKAIDPFYPQVYQHLIEIYQKLDKPDLVKVNQAKLKAITWD